MVKRVGSISTCFPCRRADEASAAARSLSDTADGERRRRRLPEGTSEYQASWIIESDEDDDGDEEEEEYDHAGGEEDNDNVDMTLTVGARTF